MPGQWASSALCRCLRSAEAEAKSKGSQRVLRAAPFVVVVGLVASACSAAATEPAPTEPAPTEPATAPAGNQEAIVLPLSLYVVLDADASDGSPWSSERDTARLEDIAVRMGEIWAEAGIRFGPVTVATIEVPTEALVDLARLEPRTFLAGAGVEFDIPDPGVLNGFYVANLSSVNGFAPTNTRTFYVTDRPTVHDERVSSHEVGHLLGLHHALDDSGRLMFGGTNGMALTDDEITVARYFANGILDAVR